MDDFGYRSGAEGPELHCEGVRLAGIAEAVGTPVYIYSSAVLERRFTAFRDAFAPGQDVLVAYAVKANGSLSVLRTLARLGAGADTVSEGEIRRALAAGVPASRIVFSGVGKTDAELAFALDAGVSEINLESEPELHRLAAIAADKGARATVALRVNPDVGAGGHPKITTGSDDNKFGISAADAERLYAQACARPEFDVAGLACHIGSQITELEPLRLAFTALRRMTLRLRAEGLTVRRLDLGGGLGTPYGDGAQPPPIAAYAQTVLSTVGDLDVKLSFEPGRWMAAEAGVLLSRVIHLHRRPGGRRFLVLDAGMNDLVRPAMYDAFHAIRPVRAPAADAEEAPYDVVGPVCETGDTFARDRPLPALGPGDLVAFMTAGAYGASMASEYNSRPLPAEVLVRGGAFAVTRPRPSYEEMLGRDRIAPWLA